MPSDAMSLKWVDDGKTTRDPALIVEENKLLAYNRLFLAAVFNTKHRKRCNDLIWAERTNSGNFQVQEEAGVSRLRSERHRARTAVMAQAYDRAFEQQWVHRDPCPKCGVRADLHGKSCRQTA